MLFAALLFVCVSGDKAGKFDPEVTRVDIERTVAYLASDELEGRDTGSAGAEKAAKFLANALARAGVEPAGDDGKWLQKVPITRTTFREVPKLSVWTEDGKERACVAGVDFDWFSGAPGTKRLRTRVVTNDEQMLPFADDEVALFLDGSMQDRRRWLSATKGVGFGLIITPGSEKPGTKPMETPPRESKAAGRPEEQPTGQLRLHGEVLALLRAGKLKAVRVYASVERVELPAFNVIGRIRGAGTADKPELAQECVVFSAHYDHIGVGKAVPGKDADTIRNGADDDASGCAAVIEVAEALAAGPKPARSLVFLLATAEEIGLIGTEWYIEHPLFPLEKTACNLNFEMIGRPDAQVGGAGKLWLTGDERSNLGARFRELGMPVVADPRPSQNFFQRSDNYAFARRGVVAQTLSTFDPEAHKDYHGVDDELERLDLDHMAEAVRASLPGVRALAEGALTPAWNPGGDPSKR
jgi:hypothetical protein